MEIDNNEAGISTTEVQSKEVNKENCKRSLNILKDIKCLGCTNEKKCAATYRTYLDLCETRKYQEVSYKYCPNIQELFITAKKTSADEEEIVIPFVATAKISMEKIEKLQDNFSRPTIKLAICDPSSTIICLFNTLFCFRIDKVHGAMFNQIFFPTLQPHEEIVTVGKYLTKKNSFITTLC
ncbi:CLUMA_CG016120, isoform A [Clunio marinus]|uniref:CLUMA_CG016120, isoform A n=1 Tax=Clunio marinus TaxID=568069 RepID=A0A1J1IRP0_9DIPT|nr:CLUMA_CG016120, isoform A [Clunio marinus]